MQRIRSFRNNIRFPNHIQPEARDFIKCCLKKNPYKRWNIFRLLRHPFLNSQLSNAGDKVKKDSSSKSKFENVCMSTYLESSKDLQPLTVNQESENSSLKSTYRLPKDRLNLLQFKKPISIAEIQAKLLEFRSRGSLSNTFFENETPKFFSSKSERHSKFTFNFDDRFPNEA